MWVHRRLPQIDAAPADNVPFNGVSKLPRPTKPAHSWAGLLISNILYHRHPGTPQFKQVEPGLGYAALWFGPLLCPSGLIVAHFG